MRKTAQNPRSERGPSRRRGRTRTLAAAAGLAALLLAAGWFLARPAEPGPRPRNVLLITIDTLRADAIGVYGNASAATPTLDRLAAGGLRFTHAHAHNVVTLPSHANILTGRLPPDHGVRDNAGFRLPAAQETLATRLEARGFRTGAFISAFPLDSRFGLARGFDVYDDAFVDAVPRPALLEQERPGMDTIAAALAWLASPQAGGPDASSPWFAWIHLYEPHYPYAPPEPLASRFRSDPYAGEVAAADAALAPILQPILDRGAATDTLVIVTSDHGESLGDHGEATHGIFAYEAALRVPLLVYYPPRVQAGVIEAPVSHVDILPTILDALGLPPADAVRGRSLIDGALAREPGRPTYFEALSGSLNRGWAPLTGIVADGFKYIELPVPELYDLRSDPRESRNLADSEPARVEAGRRHLRSLATLEVTRVDETAEVTDRLRTLGYLAGGSSSPKSAPTEADDPKRLIAVESSLQDVVRLYLEGDVPAALARVRAVLASHPDMRVALLQRAHLEREVGNLPAGIEALQRAVSIDPGDSEAASLLGAYLTAAGRPREAAKVLEPYAATAAADPQVLVALALAEARSSRFAEALGVLDRARTQDPSNAMLLVTTGTVELMAGRPAQARAAFESALTRNPNIARAHSSLAALDAEAGRVDASLAHWRQATALDPAEYEKLLAIGVSLARAGRAADARPYLQRFADSAPTPRYAEEIARARAWLSGERR